MTIDGKDRDVAASKLTTETMQRDVAIRSADGRPSSTDGSGFPLSALLDLLHVPVERVDTVTVERPDGGTSRAMTQAQIRDGFDGDPGCPRCQATFNGAYGSFTSVRFVRPLADAQDSNSLDLIDGADGAQLHVTVALRADTKPLDVQATLVTADPQPGQPVSLRASGAEDYAWDYGDGDSGAGAPTEHVYRAGGTYTATVTGSTADGGFGVDSVQVQVGPRGDEGGQATTPVPAPGQPAGDGSGGAGTGGGAAPTGSGSGSAGAQSGPTQGSASATTPARQTSAQERKQGRDAAARRTRAGAGRSSDDQQPTTATSPAPAAPARTPAPTPSPATTSAPPAAGAGAAQDPARAARPPRAKRPARRSERTGATGASGPSGASGATGPPGASGGGTDVRGQAVAGTGSPSDLPAALAAADALAAKLPATPQQARGGAGTASGLPGWLGGGALLAVLLGAGALREGPRRHRLAT